MIGGQKLSTQRIAVRGATVVRSVPVATWSRPSPSRDEEWIKPSYIPGPSTTPMYEPRRNNDEARPLYNPTPEFRPAELPDRNKEMPEGPKMPERRPDPIPAGNPKEKPGGGDDAETSREEPPAST
eukprot:gene9991-7872_t